MSVYLYNDNIVVAADFESELINLKGQPLSLEEVYRLGLPEDFPYYLRITSPVEDAVQVYSKREISYLQQNMERDISSNSSNSSNCDESGFQMIFDMTITKLREKCQNLNWEKVNEKPDTNDEQSNEIMRVLLGKMAKFRHDHIFELTKHVLLSDIVEALCRCYLDVHGHSPITRNNVIEMITENTKVSEANYIYRTNLMAYELYTYFYLVAMKDNLPESDYDRIVEHVRHYIGHVYPNWASHINVDMRFEHLFKTIVEMENEFSTILKVPLLYGKVENYSYNAAAYDSRYPVYLIQFETDGDNNSSSHDTYFPLRFVAFMKYSGFDFLSNQLVGYRGTEEEVTRFFNKYFVNAREGIKTRERNQRRNRPQTAISKEEFIEYMKRVVTDAKR